MIERLAQLSSPVALAVGLLSAAAAVALAIRGPISGFGLALTVTAVVFVPTALVGTAVLRTGPRNPVGWILLVAGAMLPLSVFGQVVSDATYVFGHQPRYPGAGGRQPGQRVRLRLLGPADRPVRVAAVPRRPAGRRGNPPPPPYPLARPHLLGHAGRPDRLLLVFALARRSYDRCPHAEPDRRSALPGLGGVEAARQILRARPQTAIVMLTMMDEDDSVFAAMRAGARGYVLKGSQPAEILRAVVAVASGQAIFGRDVAERMAGYFAEAGQAGAARPFGQLTAREREILELLAAGAGNGRSPPGWV